MSTKLKIKVTKEILERSKNCIKNNSLGENCAIAVAVRDIFPQAWVRSWYIMPFGWNNPTDILMPHEAIAFIKKFDNAEVIDRPSLHELEFEIEIPDEVINQINIEELRPLLVNHPTLELA